jgi:hypothetical protein
MQLMQRIIIYQFVVFVELSLAPTAKEYLAPFFKPA